jgi:hypothetical protein
MRRAISLLGLVILIFGCGLGFFLAWSVLDARVDVLFDSLASGALPLEGKLQCPMFITRGATANVIAAIENRIDDHHYYSVHIDALDFEIGGAEQGFGLRLSPRETREVAWTLVGPETGCFVVFVGAISDSDSSRCGNLPCLWTTSYQLGCGICVIDILGLPPQFVYLLSLVGILGGAIILVPQLLQKWRQRRQRAADKAIEG